MEIKTNTILRAYSKISPSILKDYVTKNNIEEYEFVNQSQLTETLKGYVPEIEDAEPGVVYGRGLKNGELTWIETILPSTILYYGMSPTETLPEVPAEFISTLNSTFSAISGGNTFKVSYAPEVNGYFWFICTEKVVSATYTSGNQNYVDSLTNLGSVEITINNQKKTFYVYRTSHKYAAIQINGVWGAYDYTVLTQEE